MKWSEIFEILERYGLDPYCVTTKEGEINFGLEEEQIQELVDGSEWDELVENGFMIEGGELVRYL